MSLMTPGATPSPAFPVSPGQSDPNTVASLAARRASGKLGWRWPLFFCFMRSPLLAAGFAIAAWVYHAAGDAHPALLAQAFTRYDTPLLADMVCLGLLIWRLRREGLTLKDLVRPTRRRLVRDLLLGVLILAPVAGVVGVFNVLYAVFSPSTALQGVGGAAILNPLGAPWHVVITLLIIPITSGATEELVYRGYALPRLEMLTGRRWLAIVIMAAGFGLQHVPFSLVDWRLAVIG